MYQPKNRISCSNSPNISDDVLSPDLCKELNRKLNILRSHMHHKRVQDRPPLSPIPGNRRSPSMMERRNTVPKSSSRSKRSHSAYRSECFNFRSTYGAFTNDFKAMYDGVKESSRDVPRLNDVLRSVRDVVTQMCSIHAPMVYQNSTDPYVAQRKAHHTNGETSAKTLKHESNDIFSIVQEVIESISSVYRPPSPCPCRGNEFELMRKLKRLYKNQPIVQVCDCLQLDTIIDEWIEGLPIYVNSSRHEKQMRDEIFKKLKSDLKRQIRDPDKWKSTIMRSLDATPMWLPPDASDRESLKNKLTNNLIERLGVVHDKIIPKGDKLKNVVNKWVSKLPLSEESSLDKDTIANQFTRDLKAVAVSTVNDNILNDILAQTIVKNLKYLPLSCPKKKRNELAEELALKLHELKHSEIKPLESKLSNAIFIWLGDVELDVKNSDEMNEIVDQLTHDVLRIINNKKSDEMWKDLKDIALNKLSKTQSNISLKDKHQTATNFANTISEVLIEDTIRKWTDTIPIVPSRNVDKGEFSHGVSIKMIEEYKKDLNDSNSEKNIIMSEVNELPVALDYNGKTNLVDYLIKDLNQLPKPQTCDYIYKTISQFLKEHFESLANKAEVAKYMTSDIRNIFFQFQTPTDIYSNLINTVKTHLNEIQQVPNVEEIDKTANMLANLLIKAKVYETIREKTDDVPLVTNADRDGLLEAMHSEINITMKTMPEDNIVESLRESVLRVLNNFAINCNGEEKRKIAENLVESLTRIPLKLNDNFFSISEVVQGYCGDVIFFDDLDKQVGRDLIYETIINYLNSKNIAATYTDKAKFIQDMSTSVKKIFTEFQAPDDIWLNLQLLVHQDLSKILDDFGTIETQNADKELSNLLIKTKIHETIREKARNLALVNKSDMESLIQTMNSELNLTIDTTSKENLEEALKNTALVVINKFATTFTGDEKRFFSMELVDALQKLPLKQGLQEAISVNSAEGALNTKNSSLEWNPKTIPKGKDNVKGPKTVDNKNIIFEDILTNEKNSDEKIRSEKSPTKKLRSSIKSFGEKYITNTIDTTNVPSSSFSKPAPISDTFRDTSSEYSSTEQADQKVKNNKIHKSNKKGSKTKNRFYRYVTVNSSTMSECSCIDRDRSSVVKKKSKSVFYCSSKTGLSKRSSKITKLEDWQALDSLKHQKESFDSLEIQDICLETQGSILKDSQNDKHIIQNDIVQTRAIYTEQEDIEKDKNMKNILEKRIEDWVDYVNEFMKLFLAKSDKKTIDSFTTFLISVDPCVLDDKESRYKLQQKIAEMLKVALENRFKYFDSTTQFKLAGELLDELSQLSLLHFEKHSVEHIIKTWINKIPQMNPKNSLELISNEKFAQELSKMFLNLESHKFEVNQLENILKYKFEAKLDTTLKDRQQFLNTNDKKKLVDELIETLEEKIKTLNINYDNISSDSYQECLSTVSPKTIIEDEKSLEENENSNVDDQIMIKHFTQEFNKNLTDLDKQGIPINVVKNIHTLNNEIAYVLYTTAMKRRKEYDTKAMIKEIDKLLKGLEKYLFSVEYLDHIENLRDDIARYVEKWLDNISLFKAHDEKENQKLIGNITSIVFQYIKTNASFYLSRSFSDENVLKEGKLDDVNCKNDKDCMDSKPGCSKQFISNTDNKHTCESSHDIFEDIRNVLIDEAGFLEFDAEIFINAMLKAKNQAIDTFTKVK